SHSLVFLLFFSMSSATSDIYTLSLHDALPIWPMLYCFHCSPFSIASWRDPLSSNGGPGLCPSPSNEVRMCCWPATHTYFVRWARSEEHTSELQSQSNLVCRLLLEKKKYKKKKK